ncbi:ATP-dependent permease [Paramarasmius palmivorus]|uniref:ATP-dependent permease n=1 Tax=Paramarasmius palmivorus TaxID=297713 RepID=A0AAW0B2U8_9AGAR
MRKINPNGPVKGEMTLHDVSFSYPGSEGNKTQALKDIELFIPAGETTFLVGASGSGKSSLAGLLAGYYAPENGQILLDDQDLAYLDESYIREHVGVVSQGVPPILPGESIHFNIAIGLPQNQEQVTRAQVVDACRAALLHDFIRDLPDGYDTILGAPPMASEEKPIEFEGGVSASGGVYLSPGQLQRLSLARAYLRNPPVLILDEPTSALDPVGRELVMSALREWRRGKTSVVVGHEFGFGETAMIQPNDFVYVLKDGEVAECGFRSDLENIKGGEFVRLLRVMRGEEEDIDDEEEYEEEEEALPTYRQSQLLEERRQSLHPRLTLASGVAGWMLDVVNDLTSSNTTSRESLLPTAANSRRNTFNPRPLSRIPPVPPLNLTNANKLRKSASLEQISPTVERSRRASLQFTPTSPSFSKQSFVTEDDDEFEQEKDVIEMSGRAAQRRARPVRRTRNAGVLEIKVEKPQDASSETAQGPPPGLFRTLKRIFPTIQRRRLPVIVLGLFAALASGAMIPTFSFLLSRLLFLVSIIPSSTPPAKEEVNKWGGIVLSIVVLDGFLIGLKFWLNEGESGRWVCNVRERVMKGVVGVERSWWDASTSNVNSGSKEGKANGYTPMGLVPVITTTLPLIRPLLSLILPQSLTTLSIFSISLLLALIRGWELTLTGIALVPVFLGVMTLQGRLVAAQESRILRAKDRIANELVLFVSAVKGIRGAGLQHTYTQRMDDAVRESCRVGVRGAFVEGATLGVASALIYLSEGVLFYVGAVLVSGGRVPYVKMVETLNLVVFAVSIGGQGVGFINKIAKTLEATDQIMRLLEDVERYPRTQNPAKFIPSLSQSRSYEVHFDNVSFAYPSAPTENEYSGTLTLLYDLESCSAVVGSSGGGKDFPSAQVELSRYTWLTDIPNEGKSKAKELSGGQAQRVMIARALERVPSARVLVMDEPTSALDAIREEGVLTSLRDYIEQDGERMGMMVTHRLPAMKAASRILVLDGGRVVEEGTFNQLMECPSDEGVFKRLASGGVWGV